MEVFVFKKFVATFILTAFTQVYAYSPIQQSMAVSDELTRSFDELNYKMNVEWDQKDPGFMDEALKEFEKNIADLQAQGLSNNELVEYTLGKIKDKKTRDEISELTSAINEGQLNPEEARSFAISKMNSIYSHGASWTGGRAGLHVAFVLGVVVLLVYCAQHAGKQGPPGPKGDTGAPGQDGEDGHDGEDCPPEKHDHGGKKHHYNNGYGNGDQDAPGNSCTHNNAENSNCPS